MIKLVYNPEHNNWVFHYVDLDLDVWLENETPHFPTHFKATKAARNKGWIVNADDSVDTCGSGKLTIEHVEYS